MKFDEPNDRSKDPSRDCRGAKPDCNKLSLTYSCQGSLPANAVKNNDQAPTASDKSYFYAPNSKEACSFQCKEGYNWNSQKKECVKSGTPSEKPISVYLQSRCDKEISNCIVNVVGFR